MINFNKKVVLLIVFLLVFSTSSGAIAEVIEIKIAGFSGPEINAHKRLAGEFERKTNGEIKVTVEEIARSMYDTKILATVTPNSSPYDLVLASVDRSKAWRDAGLLNPLDSLFNNPDLLDAEEYDIDDYPKAMLDLFTENNKLYGIPQKASAILMFYRKDIFEKYGIPEPPDNGYNWDEFISTAIKIQENLREDGEEDMYAVVHCGKRSVHVGMEVQQAIWSYGGKMYDEEKHPVFTQRKAREAIRTYLNMRLKHNIVTPGVTGFEYPEVLTAFQQGQAAIAIQWDAAASTFMDPEKSPKTGGNTGVTVFPYNEKLGSETKRIYPSIHSLAMTAASNEKEAAFKYLTWFTSKEISRDYLENEGGASGRTSVMTEPEVLEEYPWFKALSKSMELYYPLEVFPEYRYVLEEIFAARLNGALSEDLTIEKSIDTAAEEAEEYLKDRGYYQD